MPSSAVTRARRAALAAASLLAAAVAVHLVLALARRGGPLDPPTVHLTPVLLALAGVIALTSWALLGERRDQVTARIRSHHRGPHPVLEADDLTVAPGEGAPAWDTPATRAAWKASWRGAIAPAATAVVAATALGLTHVMTGMAADDLARTGVRTPAQVTAGGWTWTGLGSSPWVRVTHVEQGGTVSSTVHGADPAVLPIGTQTTVLVNPDDVTRVRAVDSPNVSVATRWWSTLLVMVLAGALAWLLVLALRRLLWRRRLRALPWSPWTLTARDGHVELDPAPEATVTSPLTVVATVPTSVAALWRRRRDSRTGEAPSHDGQPTPVALVPGAADTVLLRRRVLVATEAGLTELRLPSSIAEHRRLVGRRPVAATDASVSD